MIAEASTRNEASHKDRYKTDRRKSTRREEDKLGELAYRERARKLHSLLELGQLIGLDLQLNDMLSQIALKACEENVTEEDVFKTHTEVEIFVEATGGEI